MLNVVDLSKSFKLEHGFVQAVDHLSFQVHEGEVYGLMGPNGAGKTTTLRMVLGLIDPDSGYAEVNGARTDVNADEVKANLGFVSASDGVYSWLTVREMLLFFADLYGTPPDVAEARLNELATMLDVHKLLDRRAGALSTGQRQRVTLVRGLIHDPPVMLLDEPTRGLDVVGCQAIFHYIEYLRSIGKAVVICTHGLDEAERLCDRFGLLYQGRLQHEGTLDELRASTGHEHLMEMFVALMNQFQDGAGTSSTANASA